MGNQGEIHHLLHGTGKEHRPPGAAGGHDIAVVSKNGKPLRGQGTGGNVKNGAGQLAGNFIHVGDHEQQALAGRKGGRERAGLQRAMHGAGRPAFGLHFDHLRGCPPNVFVVMYTPDISQLTHHGRGGNGINSNDFTEFIGNLRGRLVAVNGRNLTSGCTRCIMNCRLCHSVLLSTNLDCH